MNRYHIATVLTLADHDTIAQHVWSEVVSQWPEEIILANIEPGVMDLYHITEGSDYLSQRMSRHVLDVISLSN